VLCFSDSLLRLRALLLELFDVSREVEDDSLAFRGNDALWVELDPLKELPVELALARTTEEHFMDDLCLSDT
jgi:hypothetical protein